jgi:pyrimidine-nucleoside phosphorylase
VKEAKAPREGAVVGLGALAVGVAALELGAGRRTKEDPVDHSVGIVLRAKRGDEIASGDVLAEIHASDDASADRAVEAVLAAYEIGDERPRARGILIDVVE